MLILRYFKIKLKIFVREDKINFIWFEPEEDCYKTCVPKDFFNSKFIHNNSLRLFTLIVRDKRNIGYKDRVYPIEIVNQTFKLRAIVEAEIVIVDSYRLGDKLVCYLRENDKNKKTIFIQHGRYLDKYTRSLNKHTRTKTFAYLNFFLLSFFSYPIKTFSFFLSQRKCKFSFGILYSPIDYWKKFISRRGVNFTKYVEIQDRDFERFEIAKNKTKCVLYCAQSVVEDGRASKRKLKVFGEELKSFCNHFNFPLIIRPHPRSDIEMLKVIFPMASFENKDVIVNPHLYISHHSAITTLFLKNNIPSILYKVNNEEIPQGISSENSLMIVSKIRKNDYKKIKNFIEEDFVRDKEFFKSKANVTQLIENFVNYSN